MLHELLRTLCERWREAAREIGGIFGEWLVHASLLILLTKAAAAFGFSH